MLEITVQTFHFCHVILLSGAIDSTTSHEFSEKAGAIIQTGNGKLVLDFAKVEFLSSAGLRVILTLAKDCRQKGGDLRIAAISERVCKVLDLGGFTQILKLFASVDEAVESFDV